MSILSRRLLLAQLAALGAACTTESLDSAGDRIVIQPTPTATAEIQQALDEGLEVILVKGEYALTAPLRIGSGARLHGAGSGLTRLVAAFQADEGDADSPKNALLLVSGSAELDLGTGLLAESIAKDERELTLTAPIANLAPGMWILVWGPNLIEDEYEMSDAAPLYELLEVEGVAGNVIGLATAAMQFHSVGTQARVVDPARDVELQGFDLSAEGGTIAVGVALQTAVDVRIRDVSGAGFSRALFELGPGSRGVRLEQIRSRGEVNAIVLASSAMDVLIDGVQSTENRKRAHDLGIPRGLITFQHRCTSVIVTSGILVGGCIGLRTWGGHHIYFSDLLIRDMDPTLALERDVLLEGGVVGVGVDSGAGPLDHAEFARDVSYVNVHLENCRQPSVLDQASWYLHDIWGVTITGCSIVNKGASASTATSHVTGMLASDVSGAIDSLTIQGANYAFRTRNVTVDLEIQLLEILGTAGEGYNGNLGVWLDHRVDVSGKSPRFVHLKMSNVPYYFYAGTDFQNDPDWRILVDRFEADGFTAEACIITYSSEAPFAMGEVAEVDPEVTSQTRLKTPAGPSSRCVVVASGAPHSHGTRFMLASQRPNGVTHVLCTSAEVAYGDLLIASASSPRRAEVDNSPADPFVVLGKALHAKPAGAEGLVLIGPA